MEKAGKGIKGVDTEERFDCVKFVMPVTYLSRNVHQEGRCMT